MNMAERRYQQQPPPHHRRKAPSFSSSLLDSILRSIDDDDTHLQQHHHHDYDHDLHLMFSEPPKRSTKIHLINNEQEPMPNGTLRRAIMIDQWMDNRNAYNNPKLSSDSSSSTGTGTTTFTTSSETETPSTYRSLPNSFTISRDPDHDAHQPKPKFMKSTRLRAMKIYGDLKKVKQPISPGSRISAFIYSLFASSKKSKMEDSMQNFRSLKKSRSIKQQQQQQQESTFTRSSCMSKKQHCSVKRSVRFYPDNDNDRKSKSDIHDQRVSDSKYDRRRWFTDKTNNNNNYMDVEDDDEDEDDLFELEIVGGVAYRQELPVFETTDLRKIRI